MKRSLVSCSRSFCGSNRPLVSSKFLTAATYRPLCTAATQSVPAEASKITTTDAAPIKATEHPKTHGGGFGSLLKTVLFLGVAAGAGYGGYTMGYYDSEGKFKKPRPFRTAVAAEETAPTALNPNDFVPFTLKEKIVLNHDTRIFRFALPPKHKLGLPVASCLVTRTQGADGKPVVRPYTPISTEDTIGYFDLLIKVYPTGVMSTHIDNLKPGDTLEMKGPISKIPYTANMKKEIGMLAGGTGITPMYQLLMKILNNPADKTKVSLVFCNKSVDDILLKKDLDALAAKHPNFKVYYMVDAAPAQGNWKGGVGFITKNVIQERMPAPSEQNLVLVCGPQGFYNTVSGGKTPDYKQGPLTGFLKELGYDESQVFKF